MALEQIKAQEDELRELMIYTGRAGMWQDWIKFQSQAAQRREEQRKEELRLKAQREQKMYEYFEMAVAAVLIIGSIVGIGFAYYYIKMN